MPNRLNQANPKEVESTNTTRNVAISPKVVAPSLPKGGGAISGMGEKFTFHPSNGTGSCSIPLYTSPGRQNFGPQLALSYDSGQGNGPFGLGWNLSIPAISRKTAKGLPKYRNDGEHADIFMLQGHDDLVLDGNGHRQEDGYFIQLYRPRTEGEYARIERWKHGLTGDIHWRILNGNNVLSIYGQMEEARIADPVDPSHVFSWLLQEARDDKGNIIHYMYKQENLEGIHRASLSERGRMNGSSKVVNRYLKYILYGNQKPHVPDHWLFRTVFDYGEHDENNPLVEESHPWQLRKDPFSTYRAGFDIRTFRLCQRVLMFHHMEETGTEPCLVRSTDLTYSEDCKVTLLKTARQTGWIRDPAQDDYRIKSMPPLSFEYSTLSLQDTIQTLDADSLQQLPYGLDGGSYQWADLNSEGIPGVLANQSDTLYYKRNLGDGRLAQMEVLPSQPSTLPLSGDHPRMLDLSNEGQRCYAHYSGDIPGYYEMNTEGAWESFVPFSSLPHVNWDDPSLHFVDLDGDGLPDLILNAQDDLIWYPSLGKGGFSASQNKIQTFDELQVPRVVLGAHSRSEALYFADMSGDGLSDLVRIRNGDVCYWPNLGHGRFGARIMMDHAPYLDEPDQFDPNRIHFADLDSSGTTDLLYIGHKGVRIWFNHAGNGWSPPHQLHTLPRTDNISSVAVADILGNGTCCLVWSSPLPANMGRQVRYIDLLDSKKPYLLNSYANNVGMETVLHYTSSTRFYLQDAASGTPWITKLPFPVHVLERVEYIDHVLGRNHAQRFGYHHGYYDRIENEFRGFGLVEQWDVESFDPKEGLDQPPVYTKTWYHTGSVQDRASIAKQFAADYYSGDQQAVTLAASMLPLDMTATELQEACRALKGKVLRQEVYGLDDSSHSNHPYQVSEHAYTITCLHRKGEGTHAIFHVTEREKLEFHYERDPGDPRISHHMVLQMDLFGHVTQSVELGYPRRKSTCDEQQRLFVLLREWQYVNLAGKEDGYRIGIPISNSEYELTGLSPSVNKIYGVQEVLHAALEADEIPFDMSPSEDTYQKRLLNRQRTMYYSDDLSGHLPYGEAEYMALALQSLQQVFNLDMLHSLFDDKVDLNWLTEEGGYQERDGIWWIPSYRPLYDADRFYQIVQEIDPYGSAFTYEYDCYALLIKRTINPHPFEQAITKFHNNYRTLQPVQVTDPNGNRQAVLYDELGMVTATAVMGKEGQHDGDTLEDPTSRIGYEMFNWFERGKPNYSHTLHREQHGASNTRWQESYVYYGGFGQEILTKVQAGTGLTGIAHEREHTVKLLQRDQDSPRWIGTGRTIFNNKGKAVKQFEPYYSSTPDYEENPDQIENGVSPIFRYDPLGRLMRTDHPNGTYTKVEFNSWEFAHWDENDTVKSSLWYADRNTLDSSAPDQAAEIRAAKLASNADSTPTLERIDSMGRVVRKIEDNGSQGKYATRIQLDILGNQLGLFDARGVQTIKHKFDMAGRKLIIHSIDAGVKRMLPNAVGQPMRMWDSRGSQTRMMYDALHRQTHLFVQQENERELLTERLVYGEMVDGAQAKNLYGRLYLHYDGAGVIHHDLYDHSGNVLQQTRRYTKQYDCQADWSELSGLHDEGTIRSHAEPILETEQFETKQVFDALNRMTLMIVPDLTEIKPTYNEANLLEKVQVKPPEDTQWVTYVQSIDYDAKGQRSYMQYGNGVSTRYTYEPETFRLSSVVSVRSSDRVALQRLSYTYDPVGNVLEVRDESQDNTFYHNAMVSPSGQFEYDPSYRLVKANGRETMDQGRNTPPSSMDIPIKSLAHRNDGQALCRYSESYEYDEVGNILQLIHRANGSMNWNRKYAYGHHSNRLIATSLPADSEQGPYSAKYEYDLNGNMTLMPHLYGLKWDVHDRLFQVDLGGGGTAYYQYDSQGVRVRKVVQRSKGMAVERKYLNSYEVFRRWNPSGLQFERRTLHIMEGRKRIAQLEKLTIENGKEIATPLVVPRFQLGNHLGSASLELDDIGAVISYEEYFPFGGTSYWAATGTVEVSFKRYRYNGKERDEETGLYDYGQRYYAAWLGRWISCDRMFMSEPLGRMPYVYVNNNPLTMIDPDGNDGESAQNSSTTNQNFFMNMRMGIGSTSTLLAKDLSVRFYYYEKSIYSMARKNSSKISDIMAPFRAALISGDAGLAQSYFKQASQIAKTSYDHRNTTRLNARYLQSFGMHAYSKSIEKNHGSYADVFNKIKERMIKGGKYTDDIGVLHSITHKAAESRASIKDSAKTYLRGGSILSALTLAMGFHRIWEAPQDKKGEIAAQEGGGLLGGMIGSSTVSVLGVQAGNYASQNLSSSILKSINPLSYLKGFNPVFGSMLAFGVIGGYLGSQFGTVKAEKLYKDYYKE